MDFTDNELNILKVLASFLNYSDAESELADNCVVIYLYEIEKFTGLDTNVSRGVLSSLIKKGFLYIDKVNDDTCYMASDECIRYLYDHFRKKDRDF